MLQDISGAQQRAVSPLFAQFAGMALLAAGLLGLASSAFAAMTVSLGVYRPSVSKFFLDGNYDHLTDFKQVFGAPAAPGDQGLLADVTGSGVRSLVTYRGGIWYFDANRDGTTDSVVYFGGVPGDVALAADLSGSGKDGIVLYRSGAWHVSTNANGVIDTTYYFGGAPVDKPLIGDVNGTGSPALIIYRNGIWYVSSARNGVVSNIYYFGGAPNDIPAVFDYDGDGKADLAIFRNGTWYVSTNRDGIANAVFVFGTVGDVPLYAGAGAISNPRFDAARFLNQASFGPTEYEIGRVIAMGPAGWIDDQYTNAAKTSFPPMPWAPQSEPSNCTSPLTAGGPPDPFGTNCPRDLYSQYQVQRYFFFNAMTAPDQLRQRVAWALSQILVTSADLDDIAYANRDYQQLMVDHAFGNFRALLFQVTLNPFMGNYLDMVNNNKANPVTGQQPNENFARELMQLFSIGTLELNTDGSLLLDLGGQPIQTYDQTDITELSKVMTGWTYFPRPGVATISWNAPINYQYTMQPCQAAPLDSCTGTVNHHDATIKTVLGYTFSPPYLADTDLSVALDVIFYHPNVPPFIGKQLIQHLVTSNPSAAYVGRVSNVFINNGSGVRGDLKAVVKAILTDPEARQPRNPVGTTFGKLKEPVILVTNFLRHMAAATDGVDPRGRTTAMGQEVYTSPTVFNYYPSDYVIPGTTLAGPQYGIYDPTTLFARINAIYAWTLGATCPVATPAVCGPNPDATVAGSFGTKIDWAPLIALAGNVGALVDKVSDTMLYSKLPPGPRQQIMNAVGAVPAGANQLRDRARTAAYLVAISPKYQAEF